MQGDECRWAGECCGIWLSIITTYVDYLFYISSIGLGN